MSIAHQPVQINHLRRKRHVTMMTDDVVELAASYGLAALGLYTYLARRVNADGWCDLNNATLAEAFDCSKRHVQDTIATLKDAGLVRVEPRYGRNGLRLGNRFYLPRHERNPLRDQTHEPTHEPTHELRYGPALELVWENGENPSNSRGEPTHEPTHELRCHKSVTGGFTGEPTHELSRALNKELEVNSSSSSSSSSSSVEVANSSAHATPPPGVYELTEGDRRLIARYQIPAYAVQVNIDKFLAYYRAKGVTSADWSGMFQKWLLREMDFHHKQGTTWPQPPPGWSEPDGSGRPVPPPHYGVPRDPSRHLGSDGYKLWKEEVAAAKAAWEAEHGVRDE